MLAMRMRQKNAEFYFVSYPAVDLLRRVRFVSRFYGDGRQSVGGAVDGERQPDAVESFVQAIEKQEHAFQRELSRRKVRQIRDFFRYESEQPVVPGAVLLFSSEELRFKPLSGYARLGDLEDPRDPFLIIDGQHRLAGLHFYLQEPDAVPDIEVPCVIFDGKTADFATEMFVIINSTHTRINKSHLVDLYEKIEWGNDHVKRYVARLVHLLYGTSDSPLRYHVNMLGGRSQQDLWINQAQLFGEVHRLVQRPEVRACFQDGRGWFADRGYGYLSDVLRAARTAFGSAWGDNDKYMVTRDVTLKALVRLAGDLAVSLGTQHGPPTLDALVAVTAPWMDLVREFRREGFYERFPARGQVERVETIRRRMAKNAGLAKPG